MNLVFHASGDHANLQGPDEKPAEFGADVKDAILGDDQEVTVRRIEGRMVIHGFPQPRRCTFRCLALESGLQLRRLSEAPTRSHCPSRGQTGPT